jgi:hypothetical protein
VLVGQTDDWLDIILLVLLSRMLPVATIMQLTGVGWMDGWLIESNKAHYFVLLLDHLVSTCCR